AAIHHLKGQTLPSGGRSTNDRSRTVSGSPSVESRASAERRKRTKVMKEGGAPHGCSLRVRHGHTLRGNLVQHRRYRLRFGDHRVMASADLLTVPACLPGSCNETPV